MVDLCIIPECYIDTNLIETLIPPKDHYNHQKGCGTVSNRMKSDFANAFAVGIIDKDKKDIDYLKEFELIVQFKNLFLFKHKTKHHFMVQISPAMERFILNNAALCGLKMNDYNLFDDIYRFKKICKTVKSKNDFRFKSLFKDILKGGSDEFKKLTSWIIYLKEENYSADINKFKNL